MKEGSLFSLRIMSTSSKSEVPTASIKADSYNEVFFNKNLTRSLLLLQTA